MAKLKPLDGEQLLNHYKNDGRPLVLKVSGKALESDKATMQVISGVEALMQSRIKVVLVFGAGKQLDDSLERYQGHEKCAETGMRITPHNAINQVFTVREMIGQRLQDFCNYESQVLSPNVIQAIVHKKRTGTVVDVQTDNIEAIFDREQLPIVGYGGVDDHGKINVNADDVSSAIGAKLNALCVTSLTDVPGVEVPNEDGGMRLVTSITLDQCDKLLELKYKGVPVVTDGMRKKLLSLRSAVVNGAQRGQIAHFSNVKQALLSVHPSGTIITP